MLVPKDTSTGASSFELKWCMQSGDQQNAVALRQSDPFLMLEGPGRDFVILMQIVKAVEDGHDVRGITMWTLVDKCGQKREVCCIACCLCAAAGDVIEKGFDPA